MRKTLATILAIVMLISIFPCFAYAEEHNGMTDEELISEYNAIRLELASRGYTAENKRILFDHKKVQIYINGEYSIKDDWYCLALQIPIVIVNQRDDNICVQMKNTSVNGWACEVTFSPEVPAQKKMKAELLFELDATDVETLEDFEDAEFSFVLIDNDSWDTMYESKPIQIFAE